MKPLPLTDADRAAWFDWQINRRRDWRVWGALERLSFAADRRDAASMLSREQFRQQCANIRAPDMRPALWWCLYIAGLM